MILILKLLIVLAVLALVSWWAIETQRRNRKPWLAAGLVSAANSFYASAGRHEKSHRRTVDNAVATRCLLFKQGATDGSIDICGAADLPLGTVDNILDAGEPATLDLLGRGKTKPMVASGAIDAGVRVFTAANGKIQALPTDPGIFWEVGTSAEAAAADGDYIEVNDCAPKMLVVIAAQTSTAVATADATDLASAEALANALKVQLNHAIADIAAIKTSIGV